MNASGERLSRWLDCRATHCLFGVGATPAWCVRDVLAHVVGIAVDLNAQRFPEPDDVGGTVWTDVQVTRGRGRTVDDLVVGWDRLELFGRIDAEGRSTVGPTRYEHPRQR